jgi:hypothetical protein
VLHLSHERTEEGHYAERSGFLLGLLPAGILHFALVAHGGIVVEWAEVSTSALAPEAAAGVADQRGG